MDVISKYLINVIFEKVITYFSEIDLTDEETIDQDPEKGSRLMVDIHVQNTEKGLPNHQPDPTLLPTGSEMAINEAVQMFQPNEENNQPRIHTREEQPLASPVPCSEENNDATNENTTLLPSPSSSSVEDTYRKEVA